MKVGVLASILFAFVIGLPMASMAGLAPDTDGDGVPDALDNCTTVPNAGSDTDPGGSCDKDQDGIGSMCDADFNEDGAEDGSDFTIFKADFGGDPDTNGTDMNCDGATDGSDFTRFKARFSASPPPGPGPSGLSCADPTNPGGCPN